MIHVFKDYEDVPIVLKSVGAIKHIQKSILEKRFISNLFSHQSVADKLLVIYNNKCAYCEKRIYQKKEKNKIIRFYEIEHYRPKNGIQEDREHQGYYWLGLDWRNLLIACHSCNKKGSKGTRFPIQGQRVYNPPLTIDLKLDYSKCDPSISPLIDEKPLLLNPEIDFPEEHLTYNSRGKIIGLSEKGKETIKICNLDINDLERQGFINELYDFLKLKVKQFAQKKINYSVFKEDVSHFFLKKIYDGSKPDQEYSAFKKYLFNHIDKIIDDVTKPLGNKNLTDFLIKVLNELKAERFTIQQER